MITLVRLKIVHENVCGRHNRDTDVGWRTGGKGLGRKGRSSCWEMNPGHRYCGKGKMRLRQGEGDDALIELEHRGWIPNVV